MALPVSSGSLSGCVSLPILTLDSVGESSALDIQGLRQDYTFWLNPVNRRNRSSTSFSSVGFQSLSSPKSTSRRDRSSIGFSSPGPSSPSSSRSKSLWPSPPLYHSHRAEQFFRTSETRHVLSDCGLVTLPRSTATTHNRNCLDDEEELELADPGQPTPLPLEAQTSDILDKILPVSDGDDDILSTSTDFMRTGNGRSNSHQRRRVNRQPTFLERSATSRNLRVTPPPPSEQRSEQRSELLEFRAKVLQKMTTLQGAAWDSLVRLRGDKKKQVKRADFMRFMSDHFRSLTVSEHESIFKFLDSEGSDAVSSSEFRAACDATLQVEEIADLRVRWVALGYTSMHQVLFEMEGAAKKGRKWEPFDLNKRLDLAQFGAALWQVGIEKQQEHKQIFEILTRYTKSKTVSLAELRSALVAIGPPMVLEDIRMQLLAKYGTLSQAYSVLDMDEDSDLSVEEFIDWCATTMKMTPHDARKAFRLIDIDDSKSINRVELIGSLLLAEPGLAMERARKRVRQRWRSIEAAFVWHKAARESFDPEVVAPEAKEEKTNHPILEKVESERVERWRGSIARLPSAVSLQTSLDDEAEFKTLEQFKFILAKVSLVGCDTTLLFKRIDINGDGRLTSMEFVKGMRVFAPSCVLEELRMRCVERYGDVWSAFDGLSSDRKQAVLDRHQFHVVLDELDLSTNVNVDVTFDLVERIGHGIVITDLIVALEAASTGTHIPLPPSLRDAKARQEVREQMAPFRDMIEDLRGDVRQIAAHPRHESLPRGYSSAPGSYVSSSVVWQRDYSKNRAPPKAPLPMLPEPVTSMNVHDRSEPYSILLSAPDWAVENKDTTLRLLRSVSPDPFKDSGNDYIELVEEYFESAQKALAADRNVLQPKMVSPLEQHRQLKAALKAAGCK